MGTWRLRLFGSFALNGPDQTTTEFGTTRAAKLLALVTLSSQGKLKRESLADLLWPDDYFDATRLRLRQETHRLRSALKSAEPILSTTNSEISVNLSLIDTDLDAMRRASNNYINPIDLLSSLGEHAFGEFLPGWNDPAFIAERAAAVEVQLAFISRCAEALIDAGQPSEGLRIAQLMIRSHPLDEPLRLAAMRANAALGSLSSATAEYQHYRRLLREHRNAEPSEQLELTVQALLKAGPPVAEVGTFSGRIPVATDTFFGRQEEVDRLLEKLSPNSARRLVTLVGPGGIGKTRVALEVAHKLAEAYSGRIGFISLIEVKQPDEAMRAISEQIGYPVPAGVIELDYLTRALEKAPTLLIIDNLEHVPGIGQSVADLIKASPNLTILCTSRMPTKIDGEALVTLGPLDPGGEGAEMLMDMLRRSRPVASTVTGRDSAIDDLSKQLDGYPLAIRLAGARLRFLSPSELLKQLRQSANVLSSEASELPERHRSIEAAINWSLESLSPLDREVAEVIAIFPGGAGYKLADRAIDRPDLINVLERLVDSALLYINERGDDIRFRLLGPVRDFVLQQMSEANREARERQNAFAVLELIREIRPSAFGAATGSQLHWFDEEYENIQTALDWYAAHDSALAAEVLERTWPLETFRGRQSACFKRIESILRLDIPERTALRLRTAQVWLLESLTEVEEALQIISEIQPNICDDSEAESRAALVASALLFRRGHVDFEANLPIVQAAVAKSTEPLDEARLNYQIGTWRYFRRELDEAFMSLERAFASLEQAGDLALGGRCGLILGSVMSDLGRARAARSTISRATVLALASRDPLRIAHLREAEGRFAMAEGRFEEAESSFRQSLEAWSLVDSAFQMADQLHSLNQSLQAQGRYDDAADVLLQSAELWLEDGNAGGLNVCLTSVAAIQNHRGRSDDARKILAFGQEFERVHNATLILAEHNFRQELLQKIGSLPEPVGPYDLTTAFNLARTLRTNR